MTWVGGYVSGIITSEPKSYETRGEGMGQDPRKEHPRQRKEEIQKVGMSVALGRTQRKRGGQQVVEGWKVVGAEARGERQIWRGHGRRE